MKDRYVIISCICFPLLAFAFIFMATQADIRPKSNESTYRKALELYESKEASQVSTILSSDILKQENSSQLNRSKVSFIEIFNDKLSLPFEQLAFLIEDLEQEHTAILNQYLEQDIKLNPVLKISPRYRIVISIFLGVNPANFSLNHLKKINSLTKDQKRALKNFAGSNDFLLLLKQNRITKAYLSYNNLSKIYGHDHQAKGRSLSQSLSE